MRAVAQDHQVECLWQAGIGGECPARGVERRHHHLGVFLIFGL